MRGLHSRAVGCATKASGHYSHPICWRKAQSQCGNAHDQISQHHDRLPPNLVCTLTSNVSSFAWSPPDSRITFSTGLSDFGCLIERTYSYGIGRQTLQRAVCDHATGAIIFGKSSLMSTLQGAAAFRLPLKGSCHPVLPKEPAARGSFSKINTLLSPLKLLNKSDAD